MATYALLVIDMQNAYFNNDALAASRDSLIKKSNELITAARSAPIPIYNMVTEHARDKSTWTLNMLDDGQGYLFQGDEDTLNVLGLELGGTKMMTKTRDSAFFQTGLSEELNSKGINHLILLGVSTHSCILMTAADAYAHNIRVTLAKDAIASHDPRFHENTLAMLDQEYRQPSYTNKELLTIIDK